MSDPLRVTVWGENVHEREEDAVRALYPDGMHATIAAGLETSLGARVRVRTATLQQPEHGLTQAVLDDTDVLTWWGHIAHDQVDDAVVERVHAAVLGGMGLLVLHSAHYSKIFQRLLGTSCSLRWRNDGRARAGVDRRPRAPDRRRGAAADRDRRAGDVRRALRHPGARRARLRQLVRRRRGVPRRLLLAARHGRIFYFSPGDQDYPIYHHPDVSGCWPTRSQWAAPRSGRPRAAPGSPKSPRGWFE